MYHVKKAENSSFFCFWSLLCHFASFDACGAPNYRQFFFCFSPQFSSEGHIKAIYMLEKTFLVMGRNPIQRRLVNDRPPSYTIFFLSVTTRYLDYFSGILKTKCVSKTREKALSDGSKQISVR